MYHLLMFKIIMPVFVIEIVNAEHDYGSHCSPFGLTAKINELLSHQMTTSWKRFAYVWFS